jgi:signal transduction histidine kinase
MNDHANEQTSNGGEAPATEAPIRILAVEDDEDDFLITSRLLKSGNAQRFELDRVTRLDLALEHIARTPVDVVLLDLGLPDSQGWPTFVDLRHRAPHVAIILLTGMSDEALGIQAVHEGAQDYLTKGKVGRDQLIRAIRYAVERKRTEVALREARDSLEARVQERTTELARKNADLRDAVARLQEHDRAKSRFVSNVSHELRTPLSSMSYAIENLLRGVLGPVPEGIRTYLIMLREDSARLRNTVDDILDLGRIDAGTLTLNRVRVPLTAIVRHAVETIRPHAESRQRTFVLSMPRGPAFVDCDTAKTERALLNVIGNAVKFTAEGGTIGVAVHPDPDQEGMLAVDVEDDGIGIPHEHLSRVAERYFRVGEQVDGTGLGLSICKEIIELHGGCLIVESPPVGKERGTRVRIRLPASPTPTALAVDDNEDVLKLLRRELTAFGYQVVICDSGRNALNAVLASRPDLLLVDLLMPEMDGVELIAKVKANTETRGLPILVVTGTSLDIAKQKILDNFGVPVLSKPWRTAELAQKIEDAFIGRHRHANGVLAEAGIAEGA